MVFTKPLSLALALAALCPAATQQLTVAAAANLSDVMPVIGRAYEAATGNKAAFTYGSTAQLAQQIENGAPIDVFASADTEHIDALAAKGLITKQTHPVYATGVLALWFPSDAGSKIEDLTSPKIKVIALAKPELAPYGQATVDLLKRLGLYYKTNSKFVYSSSISMAKQYGASGNADAVFTALSLLLTVKGRVVPLDALLPQAVGVVKASGNRETAQEFERFLLGPQAHAILLKYGYK